MEYLYAVQDDTGREIISWKGEVDKVGDVTVRREKGRVSLERDAGEDEVQNLAQSDDPDPKKPLFLHRWNADDKLAAPVSKRIPRAKQVD